MFIVFAPRPRARRFACAFAALAAASAHAQTAAPAAGANPPAGSADGTVTLSPFEVNTTADRGYSATSSLSGTRLNSKLEDIAASISVVTKEQLWDTVSTDINDVFRYEASTEGIYQFTSFNVDRGNVSDAVANNPHGATRVRGLTSANNAINGIPTSLPIDTYNIASLEISRGPNSSIFGLGNTGGGVSANRERADVGGDSANFRAQVDSYEGYRAAFNINHALKPGVAAVRLLALYDDKGFERKPSEDLTRRLNALVTLKPFANTTIRAGYETYRNNNSRPNSTTPRDMVTDWIANGSPTWDPITGTVTFRTGNTAPITGVTASNIATKFGINTANTAAGLPSGVYGLALIDTALTTFPSQYIENGEVGLYTINRTPVLGAAGTGPQNTAGNFFLLQNGNFYTKLSATYPLFVPKSISDRSLYDWTSVNLAAPNFESVTAEATTVDLEQYFLRTPRQTLALQATYYGERISNNNRRFLGAGTNTQVYIDINERLLDGTANPYFLRPYIGGSQPIFSKGYNNTDYYRATLAYQLDLTRERGWLRHLGLHNFSAYGEYLDNLRANLGYKDTISSTEAWMGTVSNRNSSSFRVYPHYLVGDATGGNVDYAPSALNDPLAPRTLRYLNGATNTWINEPVEFAEYYYANRPNKRLLSTHGGTWQAFLFDGKIIPTYGARRDYNRTRESNSAINPTAATDGYYDTSPLGLYTTNDWVARYGNTTTFGLVVKALPWLNLTYSQSNAFSPGSLAYDIYGQPLPDPRGDTKDYGFTLLLLRDQSGVPRLTVTAKQYETTDVGRGTSEINTLVQRAIRLDADGNGTGGDPDLESFYNIELLKKNPTWTTAQIDTETARLMGVDPAFIDSHRNRTHGDGSDAVSRGKEIEIAYNPTNNWTLKTTLVQAKSFNGIVSPLLQEYIANRYETWTTAVSPFDGSRYWTGGLNNTGYVVGNQTPQSWYNVNLIAPVKLAVALQGKARSQTREYRVNMVTKYRLAGLTDHKWFKNVEVGGGVRWEDKAAIGYYAAAPDADGIVRELDPNRPIYDKARTYVDLLAAYSFRFNNDKVRARVQLNVKNAFEGGRLQPVAANPDGSAWAFRIIDPRQFILSASFDL